jgi:polar amino acid transport system substrate-binding protein
MPFSSLARHPPGRSATAVALRLALVALLTLVAAACSSGEQVSALERIRAEGVVRVGYANEAPYAYLDSATGELRGEAPAIARRVFEEMGVASGEELEIEGVLTEFGSLIPGLKAGRFDLIAAGMYIKPQRCREIAFSEPTYGIGEALLVTAGNPLALHSYRDLAEHPEARLGVVAGAVELGYARALGVPEERILIFPDAPSAVAGVQGGRIDAYGGTSLTVGDLLAKAGDPGLERAEPFRNPEIAGERVKGYGAFGFRQQDTELLREFNRHLSQLIGTDEHLALVAAYGFTARELPGGVTTAELCAES